MNIRRLRNLQKAIQKYPQDFDMEGWTNQGLARQRKTHCGTVGCVAGLTCVRAGGKLSAFGDIIPGSIPGLSEQTAEFAARRLLDLNQEQSDNLFYVPVEHPQACNKPNVGWTAKYDKMYREAKTYRGRAQAAVRYFNYFIKMNGYVHSNGKPVRDLQLSRFAGLEID